MTMFEKNNFLPRTPPTPPLPGHPQRPKFPPWGMTSVTEWKSFLICFVSFICENTHKVWYKNLWNGHATQNSMIFDLLTSPQGHQFDPRMKILLAFWSALHPHRFDMPHDHVWKNFFLTPSASLSALSPTPGMTQATELKSRLICFVFFFCENKHKVWYKNLWNWLCNWN